MTVRERPNKKGPKCHYCGKFGHIRRNCGEWAQEKSNSSEKEKSMKQGDNKVRVRRRVQTVRALD